MYLQTMKLSLSLSTKRKDLPAFPGGMTWTTNGLMVAMTFTKATRATASSSQASHLSVFVHRVANPVDLGITTNGFVERVNQDDFIKLKSRVFSNPVGVKYSQGFATSANFVLESRKITFRITQVTLGGSINKFTKKNKFQ